ncbi:MAG: class II aldolase/adducin family protein [Gemmatimonadota bacterium]
MTAPRQSIRREIISVCRKLAQRGLVAGTDGNVSARSSSGTIIISPAGRAKGDLETHDLVEMHIDGTHRGAVVPSSESTMHLRIYQRRPDVNAVVHAHPPVATGFAVAGETIPGNILAETIYHLGPVALVPYAESGTGAIADAIDPFLADHDVLLLSNHGATTMGVSLAAAVHRMENLEHAARIILTARMLGSAKPLSQSEVEAVREARSRAHKSGITANSLAPGRRPGDTNSGSAAGYSRRRSK